MEPDGGASRWAGEAAKREIEELTDNLFTLYGGRKAVMMDYIYAARWLPNLGYWEKNKLSFAFERAFRANKPGQWDYIDGCLTRMRMEELNPAEEQEGDNG